MRTIDLHHGAKTFNRVGSIAKLLHRRLGIADARHKHDEHIVLGAKNLLQLLDVGDVIDNGALGRLAFG